MRFSAAFFLPALVLAAPADLEPRAGTDQSKAVINDLKTVNSTLYQLNATVNTFKPAQVLGVATALKIQQETNQLAAALQAAINSTQASDPFTSKETGKIAGHVLNLVQPINSTLNNLIAHRASFRSGVLIVGSLSKTVESILQQEQNLTATLGADLGPKLSAPFNTLAPQLTAELVGLFNPAIAAFKVCGGVLCLPPI